MKPALVFCLFILMLSSLSFCQAPRKAPELDPVRYTGPYPPDIAINHGLTAEKQILPDTSLFHYGVNPGYFGNGYTDQMVARLIFDAGGRTIRPGLSDNLTEQYGYDMREQAFQFYRDSLDMRQDVLFLNDPAADHRDTTHYCEDRSRVFAHLYDSIWTKDSAINPDNYYAAYVYNMVTHYGDYVRFWEVWNEPDINNAPNAYSLPGQRGNWYDQPPTVENLYGFYAPVYLYIRMLRITYSIVHRLRPDEYVCTGGLGYPGFLDAILRYTDNPDSGKLSPQYPLRGGAYFDVLSFHDYPSYHLHHWDNKQGGFKYTRTSDYAAADGIELKNDFQEILDRYGFDGLRFPRKLFINTEINIARKKFGDQIGSDEAQRNFIVKYMIKAQQNGILQVYIFQVGETADYQTASDPFSLMGLYENLQRDPFGEQKMTDEGIALKTLSGLCFGYRYDSTLTSGLRLPPAVDGAAFSEGSRHLYVLWAKQTLDLNEGNKTGYTFPKEMGLDTLRAYSWDYSLHPDHSAEVGAENLQLDGSPIILVP